MSEHAPYEEEGTIVDDINEELLGLLLAGILDGVDVVKVASFTGADFDSVNEEFRKTVSRITPTLNSGSQRAIDAGIDRAMSQTALSGLSIDYTDDYVQNHIRNVLTSNLSQVEETNRRAFQRIVQLGDSKGWSDQEIASRLKRYFGLVPNHINTVVNMEESLLREGATKKVAREQTQKKIDQLIEWRLRLISDTVAVDIVEGSKAQAFARLQDSGHIGPDYVKQWVAIVDSKTSEICLSLNRTTAELNGRFPDGYLYPPAHGHCRSSIRIVKRPQT